LAAKKEEENFEGVSLAAKEMETGPPSREYENANDENDAHTYRPPQPDEESDADAKKSDKE